MGSDFNPDWTTSPGQTVLDALEEQGKSLSEFSQESGLSRVDVSRLIAGGLVIDTKISEQIGKSVGGGSAFWLARQKLFSKRNGLTDGR